MNRKNGKVVGKIEILPTTFLLLNLLLEIYDKSESVSERKRVRF